MKTVTFTEIENFISNKLSPEEIEKQFGFQFSKEDGDSLSYYASETTNWDNINNKDFSVDLENNSIIYNEALPSSMLLEQIRNFSSWVSRSYDNELYPWESDAWDIGYCQGDDDVDYNSSYLEIISDFFDYYHNNNQ